MTKVHPNAIVSKTRQPALVPEVVVDRSPLVLTVWKKSLLFNCEGFTVYDSSGNLVFRIDNYTSGNKGEIVLMDASGRSLFFIRRKRLSLMDNWLVYDGETAVKPLFMVTKHVTILNTKSVAHVTAAGSNTKKPIFDIEGSYAQRACAVYDDKRRCVAEIKRKETVKGVKFGGDVFSLFVQPEIDPKVAMALVVVLDQMFL
ncbi:protein LURP-one-related 8-like [Rutidosis leptorrhynchoides]|uniref:protein LURP-one-related 8-like n=1 Tax=Rutidosis leptorrhynchoides TaxID=125765 RepID=UPI003A992E39